MESVDLTALVNLGSAGAVIAVVVIFLRSIKERDQEWRDFFTELNRNNKDDVQELTNCLQSVKDALDKHDVKASAALEGINKILAALEPKTQPRRGQRE